MQFIGGISNGIHFVFGLGFAFAFGCEFMAVTVGKEGMYLAYATEAIFCLGLFGLMMGYTEWRKGVEGVE